MDHRMRSDEPFPGDPMARLSTLANYSPSKTSLEDQNDLDLDLTPSELDFTDHVDFVGTHYYVEPAVVVYCVELLSNYDSQISPDEFVLNQLSQKMKWSEYNLLVAADIFFACLDKEAMINAIIQEFKSSTFDNLHSEWVPLEMNALKVLTYILVSESQRLDSDNLYFILRTFGVPLILDLYKFIASEPRVTSGPLFALMKIYSSEYVNDELMPNLNYSADVIQTVLEECTPVRKVERPKTTKVVPFSFENRPKKETKNKDFQDPPSTRFKARTVPKATYKGPEVKIRLKEEHKQNYVKSANLKEMRESDSGRRNTTSSTLAEMVTAKKQESEREINPDHGHDPVLVENETKSELDENENEMKHGIVEDRVVKSTDQNEIETKKECILVTEVSLPKRLNNLVHSKAFKEPRFRGKHTFTSVMRLLQIFRLRDEKERLELDRLVACTPFSDSDWEDVGLGQATNNRMEEIKLAIQKAKAATIKVALIKKEQARGVRQERELLKRQQLAQKQADLDRAKELANQLTKNAFDAGNKSALRAQQKKREAADEMKRNLNDLLIRAKKKADKERSIRHEKVLEIKAQQMLSTKPVVIKNPFETRINGTLIEMSDAEVQLRIEVFRRQNEAQVALLRAKIKNEKAEKAVKFKRALEEIEKRTTQKSNFNNK